MDAQEAASRRGLLDLTQDVETNRSRGQVDYGLGLEQTERQRGFNLEDLARSRSRSAQDLDRAGARGTEDYQAGVAALGRRYETLGRSQLQGANVAGVVRGGALLQAAAKRSANQALERQPMDVNYQRQAADIAQARQRTEEDYGSGVARVNQGADWQAGQAGLQFERGALDLGRQQERAGRENTQFGLDIGAQRAYQAAGSGWDPGEGPRNEFTRGGQTYRIVREGNRSVAYLPSGRVLWRRPFRGR